MAKEEKQKIVYESVMEDESFDASRIAKELIDSYNYLDKIPDIEVSFSKLPKTNLL